MVKKSGKETLSTLLLGDSLGELVSRLDVGEGDKSRLIVILLTPRGVRLAVTKGVDKHTALGGLYEAIDVVAGYG